MSKKTKKLLKSELVNPVANPVRVMYAHSFPKDKNYREQLEPMIGMKITVSGVYDKFAVKGTEKCEETYMLLKHVRVVETPRLSGKTDNAEIDHMWIMCPDDYVIRNQFHKGDTLHCKGTLYEYVKNIGNNPSRNIGLNLISTKKLKEKKTKKEKIISAVVIHDTKKKSALEEYERELTMQIENLIVTQNICAFYDLVMILHDYPILYETVFRNPEYFKMFVESYAKQNQTEQNVIVMNEPSETHIVKINNTSYDLTVSQDRIKFKDTLQKLVEDYANTNTAAIKNPKNKYYLVGDGKIILGVQDNQNKTYTAAKKIDFVWGSYKFIDVCRYEQNGGFSYRHFQLHG